MNAIYVICVMLHGENYCAASCAKKLTNPEQNANKIRVWLEPHITEKYVPNYKFRNASADTAPIEPGQIKKLRLMLDLGFTKISPWRWLGVLGLIGAYNELSIFK